MNTYESVCEALVNVAGMTPASAKEMTHAVDKVGDVVISKGPRETLLECVKALARKGKCRLQR